MEPITLRFQDLEGVLGRVRARFAESEFEQRGTRGQFPLSFYIGLSYITIIVLNAKRFARLKKHTQRSPARYGYVLHLLQLV